LAGCYYGVEVPLVEGDLLGADTAHAIDDDEGLWADAADELGDALDVAEDAGRGINVCKGDQLVWLLLEGLLDLLQGWAVTDGSLEVGDLCAVALETLAEGVAEVAGVEDQGVLAALDQVGGDQVPAQGATTSDDEGLCGGVGGLEELAGKS
jgi:hypothetical protein